MNNHIAWIMTVIACLAVTGQSAQAAGPLKVFILAGQSNMQGHARVSTIGYMAKDPQSVPLYHEIIGSDGKPKVSKNVWITYFSETRGGGVYQRSGQLTTGFGASKDEIGTELAFGIQMEKQLNQPILIIKTAWGGKSLNTDFRPPSGGPYQFSDKELAQIKSRHEDLAKIKAEKAKQTGHYYQLMMHDIKNVLADPKKYCPAYDPKQGYEIAGFVWFQGWNDLVDRNTYPHRDQPGGYEQYTKLLGDFIRDVRHDLKAPKLPFVIGVIGVGGKLDPADRYTPIHENFRNAMAAAAKSAEFNATAVNVQTAKCWDPLQSKVEQKVGAMKKRVHTQIEKTKKDGQKVSGKEQEKLLDKQLAATLTPGEMDAYHGISNHGFHYLGSAKILSCIGKHFAQAMIPLVQKEDDSGK